MITKAIKEAIESNTSVMRGMQRLECQDLYSQVRIPADSAASDTFERAIFNAPFDCTIASVVIVADNDVGQATNYMTLAVIDKGANGAGTTSKGSKAASTAKTLEKFKGTDLLTEAFEVDEGVSISLKKTVTEDGQAFPGGLVIVTYQYKDATAE